MQAYTSSACGNQKPLSGKHNMLKCTLWKPTAITKLKSTCVYNVKIGPWVQGYQLTWCPQVKARVTKSIGMQENHEPTHLVYAKEA